MNRHELLTRVPGLAKRVLYRISESFPDHQGRPGQVGGSLPRSGGSGSVNGEKLAAPAAPKLLPPSLSAEQEKAIAAMAAMSSEGFSYNPLSTSEPLPPNEGYMVAVKRYGKVIPVSGTTGDEQLEILRKFVIDHKEQLLKPHNFVGGWRNDDDYWLDISVPIKDFAEAWNFGVVNDQISIWDLKNKREIKLKGQKLSEAWRRLWQKKRSLVIKS